MSNIQIKTGQAPITTEIIRGRPTIFPFRQMAIDAFFELPFTPFEFKRVQSAARSFTHYNKGMKFIVYKSADNIVCKRQE